MPNPKNATSEVRDVQAQGGDGRQVQQPEQDDAQEEQNQPILDGHEDAGNGGEQERASDTRDVLGELEDDDGSGDDSGRHGIGHDDPVKRRKLLKDKLVTEYKQKKEEKGDSSVDNPDIEHTDRLRKNAKADSAAEYLGYGSIGGAATSALGAYGVAGLTVAGGALGAGIGGAVGGIMGGKDLAAETSGEIWNTGLEGAGEVINNQTSKDFFEGVGIAGNVSGTLGAGIKTGSNIYRARKDKNKYKRQAAKHRAAAGAFWGASEITGGLSHGANLGLFGDRATKEGSGAQKAGGALDIASGTAGFLSKIFDYTGNRAEKAGHKKTAEDAARLSADKTPNADSALRANKSVIEKFSSKRAEDLSAVEKKELKQAREYRHTAKAQKFAMAQAAKMHKGRSEESTKGLIGMIGGGIGMAGSIFGGLGKILGNTGGWLGMAGKALGAIAGITKTIGGGVDFLKGRKEKKKRAQNRHEVVEDYLKGKIEKIKQQAGAMTFTVGEESKLGMNGKTLSDDEAKRIAIMRLGVDIPDKVAGIPDDAYEQAFEKLTQKRANNIMHASDAEKKEMLEALGLDEDATFEDVESALKGD